MKLKLKVLSPLHIGGKEGTIYPMEYAIFNGRCYVINEDRLSKKLYDLGILKPFLEDVQRLGNDFKIEAFLKSKGLFKADFLDDMSTYSTKCEVKVYRELRTFVRNAFSQPFIPGSSIKGVFRNSIMYVILKRLTEPVRKRILYDFVRKRLEEYKRDPRGQKSYRWFQDRFKQWFAQKLDEDIFQKFTLRGNQTRSDAHTDVLRCLKVSDSNPLNKDSLTVEEIKIYSAHSSESPKRWSIFSECVPIGKDFELDFKIDENILNDFTKSNLETGFGMSFGDFSNILKNPLGAAKEMSNDLLKEDQDFFDQELNLKDLMEFVNNKPNFRLGWGKGLLGTSMGMLLPEEIRKDLRNILFRDCGDTPAPKSRRIVINPEDHNTVLGWCFVE